MNRQISIRDLSRSTVTRSRGNQAYLKLLEYLRSGEELQIDLRGQELISISFLDELVIKLNAARLLDRVTFLLSAEDTYKRLAQIAAIRNARIFYQRTEREARQPVELIYPSSLELKPATGQSR